MRYLFIIVLLCMFSCTPTTESLRDVASPELVALQDELTEVENDIFDIDCEQHDLAIDIQELQRQLNSDYHVCIDNLLWLRDYDRGVILWPEASQSDDKARVVGNLIDRQDETISELNGAWTEYNALERQRDTLTVQRTAILADIDGL